MPNVDLAFNRRFTVIALGALATIGLLEGARGVLLPHFRTDLALSATWAGAIFSSSGLGFLLNSLAFGFLSHKLGLKRMVTIGLGLIALGMTLFVTVRAPALLYVTNICLGAGFSMIELSTSIHISLIYQEKQSGMLNLLHGFFGVGALSGSLWAAFWLGLGTGWRLPYGLVGVLVALWGLYYLTMPRTVLPREEGGGQAGVGPLLKDPVVWAAALALGAAVAGEAGSTLWMPTYLQKVKGLSDGVSAGFMTAFFAGFTATRILGAWLVGRLGPVRSVVMLAGVGLASLLALLLLPGAPVILPVLAGAGVATGFATCTALVAARYPDRVNQVYTVMYSSGGLAGILTGPFMGWIGDRFGMGASMWVPLAAYGMLMLLMVYVGIASGAGRRRAMSA
ncbi:MAG TPA: MFS transporter [Symbiobacteriaceae bacterium]|nr:MFS transporter [Symbiobacteriaceae bacterium]